MRTKIVHIPEDANAETVLDELASWRSTEVKVESDTGETAYLCFESHDDYEIWWAQQ